MTTTVLGPLDDAGTVAPRHGDRPLLLAALGVGAVLELGLRGGVTNAIVAAGLAALVATLLTSGRLEQTEARALAWVALLPIACLALRASPWLAASNLAVSAVLLGAAVLHARTGSVFDLTPASMLHRLPPAVLEGAAATAALRHELVPASAVGAARARAVIRAVLIAAPILGLVVVLLATGDAVFAGLLVPDVGADRVAGHVVLTVVLAACAMVVVLATATVRPEPGRTGGRTFGFVEVTTMLGLAVAVLALFVTSQLVALTGAGDRLIARSGLTPAEYARSGFFQLCWAIAVLAAFLSVVRRLAVADVLDHATVRVLGALVPLLSTGLVAVSLRRMALYDHAFGLTMLRVWVTGAVLWMGLLLVLLVVRNARGSTGPDWVAGAAAAGLLVLVMTADAANPEAFVARHNLARAERGRSVDITYLRRLSDDATPTLVDAVGDAIQCRTRRHGAAALNLAVRRADSACARGEVG